MLMLGWLLSRTAALQLACYAALQPSTTLRSLSTVLCAPVVEAPCVEAERALWMDEYNSQHVDALFQIARRIGDEDGVDWSVEELTAVKIVGVDDEGMTVEEILCSTAGGDCIAVPLHVRWPSARPRTVAEMRQAFDSLSRRASAEPDELAAVYAAQQRQLDGMMAFLNAEHRKLLRYCALRHARGAFEPMEQLESARLTQLNFEGLSLACETIVLADEAMGERIERRRWSTSVLFDGPCTSAAEVEDRIVAMLHEADGGEAPPTSADGAAEHEDALAGVVGSEPAPWPAPPGFVWGGVY